MSAVLDNHAKDKAAATAQAPRKATNTLEPAWVRYALIAVALIFLTLFLFVPLVAVFTEAGRETGWPAREVLGAAPADAGIDFSALLAIDDVTIVDLSSSPAYRKGHIPGAWFAIRARLALALAKIPVRGELVLTSEDGVLAGLAVAEARALTKVPVLYLKGGNAAWTKAGFPLSTDSKMADEPLDVWLKPYERPNDNEAAMQAYLSWEVDLLERIQRDGTTQFLHAR